MLKRAGCAIMGFLVIAIVAIPLTLASDVKGLEEKKRTFTVVPGKELPPGCEGVIPGGIGAQLKVEETDKVVVILSESIERDQSGSTGSCSQIVNCLREREYTDGTGKTRSLSEGGVMQILRSSFPHCLIEGDDGLDLLSTYATTVYMWMLGIVGPFCILIMIGSGIQISIGGLSQEEVSTAKDRIFRSLFGLVVLFLSAFILYTINPIFFT